VGEAANVPLYYPIFRCSILHLASYTSNTKVRVQLKRDGTQWRTGGEVKWKLANGVGSQYPSLPPNLVYPALLPLMRTPRLSVVDWTDAPADLNWLVRFAERQNLVSVRVPSHFKRSLPVILVALLIFKWKLWSRLLFSITASLTRPRFKHQS